MKKYEFTGEILEVDGKVLHQIKAVRSFGNVQEGDLGGYIEHEGNLSHEGNAWVSYAVIKDGASVCTCVRQCGGVRQCACVRQCEGVRSCDSIR